MMRDSTPSIRNRVSKRRDRSFSTQSNGRKGAKRARIAEELIDAMEHERVLRDMLREIEEELREVTFQLQDVVDSREKKRLQKEVEEKVVESGLILHVRGMLGARKFASLMKQLTVLVAKGTFKTIRFAITMYSWFSFFKPLIDLALGPFDEYFYANLLDVAELGYAVSDAQKEWIGTLGYFSMLEPVMAALSAITKRGRDVWARRTQLMETAKAGKQAGTSVARVVTGRGNIKDAGHAVRDVGMFLHKYYEAWVKPEFLRRAGTASRLVGDGSDVVAQIAEDATDLSRDQVSAIGHIIGRVGTVFGLKKAVENPQQAASYALAGGATIASLGGAGGTFMWNSITALTSLTTSGFLMARSMMR